MQNRSGALRLKRFYWGVGIFAVSASTVMRVTDPYLMADIALVFVGLYLMVTGLKPQLLG